MNETRDEYGRVLCWHGRPIMCNECGEEYANELNGPVGGARADAVEKSAQSTGVIPLSEELAVAMLAACEATIRHLWDIAGRFDTAECNKIRDEIHRLNTLTLPAIQDLRAVVRSGADDGSAR